MARFGGSTGAVLFGQPKPKPHVLVLGYWVHPSYLPKLEALPPDEALAEAKKVGRPANDFQKFASKPAKSKKRMKMRARVQ